jgi:hypothetical protein
MARDPKFLPETPAEITSDWLSSVLGGTVTSSQHQELGAGQGFMGDVLLVDIESADPAVPKQLVAKLPKKENRVFGELLGVYEREILFFKEFAENLPIRAPQMYFSEFDRDKASEKQGEILRSLDNVPLFLNGAIGFIGGLIAGAKKRRYMLLIEYFGDMEPGDQLAGLDATACIQVLRNIAPLHREYWLSEKLEGHFWLLELDIDARMRQGLFNKHVKQYSKVMGPKVAEHLAWLKPHGEQLLRRLVAEAPSTLLHCDLRLDNVIFDGESCAFIDFQLVRHGPAAYDVAYFMTSALHEDATAADVDMVLQAYHTELAVPDYDFARFKRDYERALMVVLCGLASVETVEFGNERGETMMAAWLRRLVARVESVDPGTLL